MNHTKRGCCWGGHLFASNVGVLPTVPDGCTLNSRLVLSIPSRAFGKKFKERQKRMRFALLHDCSPDVTDGSPTIDSRPEGR